MPKSRANTTGPTAIILIFSKISSSTLGRTEFDLGVLYYQLGSWRFFAKIMEEDQSQNAKQLVNYALYPGLLRKISLAPFTIKCEGN